MAKMKKQPSVRYVGAGIAAETLGVSTDSLRRWAKAGKIDFMRTPGGRYRFNLDGFMASQGKGPVVAAATASGAKPAAATKATPAAKKTPADQSVDTGHKARDVSGMKPVIPHALPVLKPVPVQMDLVDAIRSAPAVPGMSAADLVAALMATPKAGAVPVIRDEPVFMPTLGELPRRRPVIEGLEHRDME